MDLVKIVRGLSVSKRINPSLKTCTPDPFHKRIWISFGMVDSLSHVTRHTHFYIYFYSSLHHFKEIWFNSIRSLFTTFRTRYMELIGFFRNSLFSVKCNVLILERLRRNKTRHIRVKVRYQWGFPSSHEDNNHVDFLSASTRTRPIIIIPKMK